MKIYKNQEEVEKDVVNGTLKMCDDIKFEFDLNMDIDIKADNIKAYDIDANNIKAYDIKANDIDANNINYYAVCFAYNNLSCKSIKGKRKNCKHFCLDVDIKIKNQHKITIDNKEIELSQESFNSLKE